jgi:hypothetical protein
MNFSESIRACSTPPRSSDVLLHVSKFNHLCHCVMAPESHRVCSTRAFQQHPILEKKSGPQRLTPH